MSHFVRLLVLVQRFPKNAYGLDANQNIYTVYKMYLYARKSQDLS